jgi:hypothetical protein
MPEGVIAAVEAMAEAEDQPSIGPGGPLFEWAPGVPIEDDIDVPILQDENEVDIVDVITAADDDEGADDDFDNGEIAPESPGEEDDEDAEEANMEENEREVAEHVENEDGGHVHDEDYELDVVHDEYEDELESVSDEDDPLGVVVTVDDEEYAGAEEVVEANDRPVRERKQTTFLADTMQYPASTKS